MLSLVRMNEIQDKCQPKHRSLSDSMYSPPPLPVRTIFEAEEIVQAKLQALSKLTNGGTKADRRWSDNLGISGTRGSRGHRPRSASSDTDASGDSQDPERFQFSSDSVKPFSNTSR